MIVKSENLRFICLFIIFLVTTNAFSQSNVLEQDDIVLISYEIEESVAIYSFEPKTEYDEFKTAQRISRFNSITADNITVEYKESKIFIKLNPHLTKDKDLNSLLEAIVKIHGYSNFELN